LVAAQAAPSVTLAWDRNPESSIAGYRLKYWTTSGSPTTTIDVGDNTTATVSDLSYSTTYYFVVTAYSTHTPSLESGPSNEVPYKTPPPQPVKLTVENGSGSGDYEPGRQVTVNADAPPKDQKFERWIDDYQILLVPTYATTTATVPYRDVKITATYSDLPKYALTVLNGSGGGSYPAKKVVTVEANPPPSGQRFSGWSGDTKYLASRSSAKTTLTMPAKNASITANYRR
jgi:hypothetical protein